MEIKVLSQSDNKLNLSIEGIDYVTANTLRRLMIAEVPTIAIEEVEFHKNGSALYDEILAHRLGLIPLKTDLKSYNIKDECKCKGKGCALCELKLTLDAENDGIVYSSQLKSTDPKAVPVYPDMPIVELIKKQKLELEATAVLGQGKKHMKFSTALAYYRGYPELVVNSNSNLKKIQEELNKAVTVRGNKIEINDLNNWNDRNEEVLE